MSNNKFHAFDVQNRKAYDDFSEVYQAYFGYKNGYDPGFVDGLHDTFTRYAQETGSPIKTILDCASGPGNPGLGLAKLGYDVYCCDLSPKMVETIKRNDIDNRLKDVRVASWYNLKDEYQGMQFDVVVCACNAVMHISDDEAFRCAWGRSSKRTKNVDLDLKTGKRENGKTRRHKQCGANAFMDWGVSKVLIASGFVLVQR